MGNSHSNPLTHSHAYTHTGKVDTQQFSDALNSFTSFLRARLLAGWLSVYVPCLSRYTARFYLLFSMIFDINLWFPVSLFSLLRWFAVLLLYLFPAHFFFLGSLPFCRCCFHTTQYLFILCTYTLNTNFNFSIYTDTIVSVCVLFTRNIHRVFPRNTCVRSVCVCVLLHRCYFSFLRFSAMRKWACILHSSERASE